MNEQKFSTRQAVTLSTMYMISQIIIMYNGSPANSDIWISILFAFAATLPLALLYARLLSVFPGKNLFDLQLELFGPVFGRMLMAFYTLFALHIAILDTKYIADFMQITSLFRTPQLISATLIGLLCIYSVKSGINTVGRYTAIAFPVYLLIIVVVMLLAITAWETPRDVSPPLYQGVRPILKSSVFLMAVLFGDSVVLTFVLQPLKKQRKARAIIVTSFSLTAAVFLMVFVQNLLVLGENVTATLYFPTYIVVSLIDIADFFQRVEVAMAAVLFMGVYVKLAVCMYVFSLGMSKLFKTADYRKLVAPAGFFIIALSQYAYPNILANISFATGYFPYYAFFFDVLFPVLIWLAAERKRKKLKDSGQLPEPPPAAEETPVARQNGNSPQNPDEAPPGPPRPAGRKV